MWTRKRLIGQGKHSISPVSWAVARTQHSNCHTPSTADNNSFPQRINKIRLKELTPPLCSDNIRSLSLSLENTKLCKIVFYSNISTYTYKYKVIRLRWCYLYTQFIYRLFLLLRQVAKIVL